MEQIQVPFTFEQPMVTNEVGRSRRRRKVAQMTAAVAFDESTTINLFVWVYYTTYFL